MIPEFLTAKPATNRNASEVPAGPETRSSNQLPNQDAFQKALQERTSDRQPEQRNSATVDSRSQSVADEDRSDSPPQRTPGDNSSAAKDVGSSKAQSVTTDDLQKQSKNNRTTSKPTGETDAASDRATTAESSDAPEDFRPDRQKSTGVIRRIDPANHSATEDVPVASTSDLRAADGNPSNAASVALPEFLSFDDADLGTLPSLIRQALEGVTVNQFSDEVIPESVSTDQVVDTRSNAAPPETLNTLDVDGGLRPFLNDTLIPDSATAETDSAISVTDPSLLKDVAANRPAKEINAQSSVDELLSIPTLPSLRSDVATTVPSVLQVPASESSIAQADGDTQIFSHPNGNTSQSADSPAINTSSLDSLLTANNQEVTSQLTEENGRLAGEQRSDHPPQVLPSLTAGRPGVAERTATEQGLKTDKRSGETRTDQKTPLRIDDATIVSDQGIQVAEVTPNPNRLIDQQAKAADPAPSINPGEKVTEQPQTDFVSVPDNTATAPLVDSQVNGQTTADGDRSERTGNARTSDQSVTASSIDEPRTGGQVTNQSAPDHELDVSDQTSAERQSNLKQARVVRPEITSQETAGVDETSTSDRSVKVADRPEPTAQILAENRTSESTGNRPVRTTVETPHVENSITPKQSLQEVTSEINPQQQDTTATDDRRIRSTRRDAAQPNGDTVRQTERTLDRSSSEQVRQASGTNGRTVPAVAKSALNTAETTNGDQSSTNQPAESTISTASGESQNDRDSAQ